MKWLDRDGVRFLIAGVFQNVVSYGAYLALLVVVSYPVAYLASFAIGVLLAFVLNSLYVFRVPLRWSRMLPYPLVYVGQAALGLAMTWALVEFARVPTAVAPALVLAATVPFAYFGNRIVLGVRNRVSTDHR